MGKGDPVVVAQRYARRYGTVGALHMQSGCAEIEKITHTGLDVFEMGVGSQDGMSGRRFLGGDYPVVAFSGALGNGNAIRADVGLTGIRLQRFWLEASFLGGQVIN